MATPADLGIRPFELGNPGPLRAWLNGLVLSGQKVASFGLLAEYEAEGESVEDVGERCGLVDDEGQHLATIEITAVERPTFEQVSWSQVEAEGEGFTDVADWRAGQLAFWEGEDQTVTESTPLVWTRFRLVDSAPLVQRVTAGDLGLPEGYRHVYSGKVRDLFLTPGDDLLVVASDRISAYDWVLPTTIPDKGRILTQMSLWWFDQLTPLTPNHVISTDVPPSVAGRAVVCERLEMFPVECVVRGYLTGSGLADYLRSGAVCGVALPPGLVDGDRLPHPIFTPATKAQLGDHDENVDFAHVAAVVGEAAAVRLRDTSLAVYDHAERLARARGIVLADTKFEFGSRGDDPSRDVLVLADEVLTPDSSRYWPADSWNPGHPQPSFDKQFVRDWLTSPASGWSRDGGDPPPPLPPDVVERTRAKYVEAYERLTGRRLA